MAFNKKWLMQKYPEGTTIPFLFFWGHQPPNDGSVSKSCFSQWWEAPFDVEGVVYRTAEHWMMTGKAKLFGDLEAAARIANAKSPGAAKNEGRLVKNFVPDVWDKHKYELVVAGNWHKFSQNSGLKDFLSGTGEHVLVEASPVDPVWGIGLAADDPKAKNPISWKGENLLGFALMEVREKLKKNG
jgi:ribA/ribD-fused uncharacterized protein